MKGFRSTDRTQRFLSAFSQISPHFRPRRRRMTAPDYRTEMTDRFTTWNLGDGRVAARGGVGQALSRWLSGVG